MRQGVRTLLEAEPDLEIVGEASDGRTGLQLIAELTPDVAVIDLMLPTLHGLELVRRVTAGQNRTKIVVLSMYDSEAYVLEALTTQPTCSSPRNSPNSSVPSVRLLPVATTSVPHCLTVPSRPTWSEPAGYRKTPTRP